MVVRIRLDDVRKTYRPGDTIQGTISCKFFQTQYLQDFTVQIWAFEGVDWDFPTRGITSSQQRYETNWTVINKEVIEVQKKLDYYEHEFPFKITLSEGLPGTFRYPNCYLKYRLAARVLWNSDEIDIHVDSPLDLNLMPKETVLTTKKTTSCLCWSNGFISTNMYMKRRTVFQSDSPQMKIDVDSKSRRKIKRIRLSLKTVIIILIIKQHIQCQDRRKELQKCLQSGEGKKKKRFLRQLLR